MTLESEPLRPKPSRVAAIVGWVLTLIVAASMLMGGVMDVIRPPFVVEGVKKAGYDPSVILPLGIVSIVCGLLYLFPRTCVLGAILITGYFGGAVATHVNQIGEPNDGVALPMTMAITFGVLTWVALVLRMPRLRALAPIVRGN